MILIINILISVSDFNSQSNLSLSPLTYVVVQSLSRVQLSANPWTAARKVSLSFSILPEFAQTHVHWVDDAIQPSHPLSPPSSPAHHLSRHESFPMSHFFASGDQSTGASASALPMNTQGWFPLGLTGLISCCSRGSQKSSPAPQFKSINSSALSLLYGPLSQQYMTTGKTIDLTIQTSIGKVMSLLFNLPSKFVLTFLPQSKCLLISWLQSSYTVILEPKKIKSVTASTFPPIYLPWSDGIRCHDLNFLNVEF